MTLHIQKEEDIINPSTEMHYAISSGYKNTFFPHAHDFFECSLLLQGDQTFSIQSDEYLLKEGSLVLIRPNEVHSREYVSAGSHINIAFSTEIAHGLFAYLGDGFPSKQLLEMRKPPFILLAPNERRRIQKRMNQVNAISFTNTTLQRTLLRTLIMDIFVQYFSRCITASADTEDWFDRLLYEIERPENLVEGLSALLVRSGCTHEHLCRLFKQRVGMSPTEYINDLRLNYAANYLLHSDISITNICYNAGFNNLSHFYHLFSKKYGTSPRRFRLLESVKKYRWSTHAHG